MKTEHKIVLGMALFGGAVTSIVIYVGGLFAPQPVTEPIPATATLLPPAVSTVVAPTATATTAPTPTPTPTAEPELRARLSHYWPAWGPPSCGSTWDGINCNALLSDGEVYENWSYFAEWGMACPIQYELGTKFKIEGFGTGVWTCVDRGGAISVLPDIGDGNGPTFFLDLMSREQPYIPPGEAEVIYDDYSPSGSYVVTVTIME